MKELKMGWRLTTRVRLVNILRWTLISTFMVVSVRARQEQTPSYEELGEILHPTSLFLNLVSIYLIISKKQQKKETSISYILYGHCMSLKSQESNVQSQ